MAKRYNSGMRFGILLALVFLVPSSSLAQWKTPWAYDGATGPDRWSELDPAYALCKAGREQSPIDIRSAQPSGAAAIRFDYRAEPLRYLINNGKTIRVNYHDAAGTGSFLVAGGKQYQLTQFHFHRPSEETVDGKPYDMEVHLMHQSNDGKVAGVVIFLKAGASNAIVQKLWDHMPQTEGGEQAIAGVDIDPTGLLPHELSHFEYMGSLSAPPCTEGVVWFVLRTPVEVSPAQIAAFARLYPHDVRPVQPLNGRIVKEGR
jgi:carbonic anhydrase